MYKRQPPNSLDTESSIKQGCKYFASLLSSVESQGIEDINVVVQSYNYGGGYIGYVAKNGKKHSFTLAENFARDKSGGKKVTYTNPIACLLYTSMSQKTFDGKKPYSFLKSQITFALRPKVTYAGKAVKLEKEVFSEPVTAVRSVMYVPD